MVADCYARGPAAIVGHFSNGGLRYTETGYKQWLRAATEYKQLVANDGFGNWLVAMATAANLW